jgi:hypothetical protein
MSIHKKYFIFGTLIFIVGVLSYFAYQYFPSKKLLVQETSHTTVINSTTTIQDRDVDSPKTASYFCENISLNEWAMSDFQPFEKRYAERQWENSEFGIFVDCKPLLPKQYDWGVVNFKTKERYYIGYDDETMRNPNSSWMPVPSVDSQGREWVTSDGKTILVMYECVNQDIVCPQQYAFADMSKIKKISGLNILTIVKSKEQDNKDYNQDPYFSNNLRSPIFHGNEKIAKLDSGTLQIVPLVDSGTKSFCFFFGQYFPDMPGNHISGVDKCPISSNQNGELIYSLFERGAKYINTKLDSVSMSQVATPTPEEVVRIKI